MHIVRGRGGGPTNILLRLIITFRAIDRRKDKGKDLNKDLETRFRQRLKQRQWQDKDGDREICKDRDIVPTLLRNKIFHIRTEQTSRF